MAGEPHALPRPFHVLATQNPIEQEGTYPLPEAQLDRFIMQIDVGYPDAATERRILLETTGERRPSKAAMSADDLLPPSACCRRLPVGESVSRPSCSSSARLAPARAIPASPAASPGPRPPRPASP